jgi:hypothetical protein
MPEAIVVARAAALIILPSLVAVKIIEPLLLLLKLAEPCSSNLAQDFQVLATAGNYVDDMASAGCHIWDYWVVIKGGVPAPIYRPRRASLR